VESGVWLIVAICRAHSVCAKTRPVSEEPVANTTLVLARSMPCMTPFAPTETVSATCQKIFLACAPPNRITFVPANCTSVPVVCKMKTSSAPPLKVMSEPMLMSVVKV